MTHTFDHSDTITRPEVARLIADVLRAGDRVRIVCGGRSDETGTVQSVEAERVVVTLDSATMFIGNVRNVARERATRVHD